MLIQKVDNTTFSNDDIRAPDLVIVAVQSLFYASLSASLLATFLAVLGKQWLNRYMSGHGGSVIERCHGRQRKADGMKRWHFPIVVEALPLMLQAALLLLGCALSQHIWIFDHIVAAVNTVITSFGVLLYLILVLLASMSYECSYQMPFSLFVHRVHRFDSKTRITSTAS